MVCLIYLPDLITALLWPIFIIAVIVCFLIGMLVNWLFQKIIGIVSAFSPFKLSRWIVDFFLRGIVVVVAIWASSLSLELDTLLSSVDPQEDFEYLKQLVFETDNTLLINVVMETVLQQLVVLTISFIPVCIVDTVIKFIEDLLCGPDDSLSWISRFIGGAATLLAVNAILLQTGDLFISIMRDFVDSIVVGFEYISFSKMLLFCVMIYFIVQDMMTNDVWLAMFAVLVAAAVMGLPMEGGTWTVLLWVAVLYGLFSSFARKFISPAAAENEMIHVYFGLASWAVCFFGTWGIWSLVSWIGSFL